MSRVSNPLRGIRRLACNVFYILSRRQLDPKKTSTHPGRENVNRLTQLDPAQATGKTKQMFDDVQAKLGFVPNLFRVLANAPAALEGYLNFSGALAGGSLNAR